MCLKMTVNHSQKAKKKRPYFRGKRTYPSEWRIDKLTYISHSKRLVPTKPRNRSNVSQKHKKSSSRRPKDLFGDRLNSKKPLIWSVRVMSISRRARLLFLFRDFDSRRLETIGGLEIEFFKSAAITPANEWARVRFFGNSRALSLAHFGEEY